MPFAAGLLFGGEQADKAYRYAPVACFGGQIGLDAGALIGHDIVHPSLFQAIRRFCYEHRL